MIYVDDFKLSGPKQNMKEGWAKLRKGLSIETEKSLTFEEGVISGTYLGCEQEIRRTKMPDGKVITSFSYSMESFLGSCVDRYLELAPQALSLSLSPRPFSQRTRKTGPPVVLAKTPVRLLSAHIVLRHRRFRRFPVLGGRNHSYPNLPLLLPSLTQNAARSVGKRAQLPGFPPRLSPSSWKKRIEGSSALSPVRFS